MEQKKRTTVSYFFRAIEVLKYDVETKQLDIGNDAFMCSFITADLKLMSEFLMACYLHARDEGPIPEEIEVN